MSNEFDAAVTAAMQPDPAQAARVGFSVAADTNPDAYAEAQRVARRTGVPVDTVLNMPGEMKQQDAMGTIDFGALAKTSPATASLLADVERAKIAHDDVANLGLVETLVNSFKRGIPALKSILPSITMANQAAGLDMYRKIDERIAAGEDPKKVLADYGDYGLAPLPWQTSEQTLAGWNSWKAKAVPKMQGDIGEAATDVARLQAERAAIPLPGVVDRTMAAKTWGDAFSEIGGDPVRFVAAIGPESLVQTAPGLVAAIPAGVSMGPGGAAAAIGGNSFLVDYASTLVEAMQSAGIDTTDPDAIRQGLKDPAVLAKITEQAGKHASVVGAFDALSGGIAGKMLLPKQIAGKLATRPLAQEMANIALQVPIQGTLGALGELGGELYAGQDIHPGYILAEFFGEFFGTPAEVVPASARRIHAKIQAAREAEQSAGTLARLNELARASNVLRRDPETFEQFIADAAEGGPAEHVFIDAHALMQSGVAEQVAAVSPAVAAQLPTAVQTGGQIAIPVGEYAARIAPTEYAQSLLDHLKVEPEGFSRAEAQEYMQSHAEELQAEVERTLADKQGDDTFKQSAEAVRAEVKAQLDTAARFTPQVNDAYSSMVGNFYAVQAARLGITPEELFQRYPLKVVAESVAGQQFEQGETIADVRKAWSEAGIKHAVSENNGTITVSQIIVPENERGAGKGTAAMQALIDYADRTGQHVVLTPSADFGGNKKRLVQFYKRFGFVENKGKNRAFSTSESMYRHADGKVLYQQGGVKAARAEPTGKISPITRKPIFELFDANGQRIGLAHSYATADAAVAGHNAAKPTAPAAPTYTLPEQELPPRSNWKQVKGQKFTAQDEDDGYLYHVTAAPNAAGIRKSGLIPNNGGMFGGAYANYSAGKVFLTERSGVSFWKSRIEDQLQHASDNPPAVVVLRIPKDKIKAQIKPDELGSKDARAGAYYAEETLYQNANEAGKVSVDGVERHTTDSRGRPIHPTAEGLRNFWRWFGDSKVVDAEGRPLVVYHGTNASFDAFDLGTVGSQTDAGHLGRGFYFSDDPRVVGEKAVAVPVYLRALDPFYASMPDFRTDKRTLVPDGAGGDSVILDYGPTGYKAKEYMVRSPEQIKSATGNAGTFDPADASILRQHTARGARGSFNPATLSITLLRSADLSTFLHESGHFFLEVLADMSARPDAPAQVQQDMDVLLSWFGVRDLQEWYNLGFEEKRGYHEQFARGFEAYLFEGKAPSIELHGIFQRFRAWLLNVYRELKNLNVELTDEVRGVFDRMLATNEQITLAEQGRSMMPLFTSPEQAGMTPEEFAAYQALGVDATAQAIEDLQARGLRDMTWLHNARGRIIKQLQKDAKAQRAEVQIDVRREVMSQPIYRAWQFLTGKLTADDKVKNPEPPKSDPNTLDATLDSLFVAVAKLGGINKAEAVGAWGLDPADKPSSGIFGKPVWRRDGGLSLDGMAEALAQFGYLGLDHDGKWDLREFEDRFGAELAGHAQYSFAYDYSAQQQIRPGEQIVNLHGLGAGRLALESLRELGLPSEIIGHLQRRRMVAKHGLHPDVVAEMFGFTSGDELVRTLAAAEAPKVEIEALTDARMLEQFGDLASPDAIAKAADKAIHNDARARFVATEANALAQATGQRKVLASAAREFARAMIARLKVRDIKPGQYASAEVRAAKAAEKASKAGDLNVAAAEKRNQLIQNYATRAAYDAQEEVDKGLRYLKKFEGDIKTLDAGYADQIGNLLERFDLRKGQSNKAVDKRTALAEWIKAQREAGIEPDIPPELENEAFRTSYKNLTVEEFRGLVDTVRQIEHLGRLKHKLLTAADQRAYEAVRDEIAASIHQHAQGREADTRTPTTNMGRAVQGLKRFWAAHIKAATWARVMDGGKDGGPMWEYFVRSANERGDQETTMRAEATAKLSEILAPVFKLGRMGGKGQFFPTINRSLNREARLAIALNIGNIGNLQRLLGGEGWTMAQLAPVLQSLTAQEWHAVQAVWDHFEGYRPQIAAKERRVYGKEPEWVAPRPFAVTTADGTTVQMRGGYYPIKYDPAASQRAEEHADAESAKRQLQGAYTTATTRRSFTKSRVEEVQGRPLLYTLSGLYSGVSDVIHDLAWHEWLIDANRLLRSHTIDAAIRDHYGPEAKQQFKTWVQDVAEGEKGADAAVDLALSRLRQGISASGLGFNVMSALIQPLGFTQSITRVGAQWVGRGVLKYLAGPIDLTRQVNRMSDFMANRTRTSFRELNELRNQVQDQSTFNEYVGRYTYFLMMRCQQMVDVPTWWGAYEKAIAGGNEETRAIALADQAVIDAQGSGQTKDLSAIERGGPAQRLFTVFYSFMNAALNVGVAQTMSADTPAKRAKLAVDYAMLYVVPAVLGYFIKSAFTPGDSGDDDDPEKIAKKLLASQIDYLMGLMVVVREFRDAAKMVAGANDMGRDWQGPTGVRLIADVGALAEQAHQGEFDDAFRKAAVNVVGDMFGLPSAQINRTITGAKALAEGKTENPAAIAFGFQEKR